MGKLRKIVESRRLRAFSRIALVALLLVCFAGLQTASVALDHSHDHGNPHNCCPICHASHVPALQALGSIQIAAPGVVNWRDAREVAAVTIAHPVAQHSSRAPPA